MRYFCRSKMAEYKGLKLESQLRSSQILKKRMSGKVITTKTKFEIIQQAECFLKFQNEYSVEH